MKKTLLGLATFALAKAVSPTAAAEPEPPQPAPVETPQTEQYQVHVPVSIGGCTAENEPARYIIVNHFDIETKGELNKDLLEDVRDIVLDAFNPIMIDAASIAEKKTLEELTQESLVGIPNEDQTTLFNKEKIDAAMADINSELENLDGIVRFHYQIDDFDVQPGEHKCQSEAPKTRKKFIPPSQEMIDQLKRQRWALSTNLRLALG